MCSGCCRCWRTRIYYADAEHGFARGSEPAAMVDKVQRILKLLEWQGESLGPAGAKDGA
jgi:hypothetical protein